MNVSEVESLVIDVDTWGQRELLEEICSRYFILGNQSGLSDFSWEINSREGGDISKDIRDLNRHLKSLSLIGLLDEGNPPILSVTRYPVDPINVPSWQQSLIWFTMFIFTTLAGCYWISQFKNIESIFSYELFMESFLFFSTPIFFTIFSAHLIRKYVSSMFNVDVGNLVPIAFPLISPFWPFGIVGVFGQKRVDTITYPNRYSLGLIELSSVITLILFGSIFSLVGLSLTTTNPPESISEPLLLQSNLIVELISNFLIGDDFLIKLQWLHPIALAGFGISIIGWILILPIPGFPGDRILHSILGSKNLDKGTNSTTIFLLTLTLMCLVFLSTTFWPWLILASLASWRRFSGEHIPVALIVDEATGLDKKSRDYLITFSMVIILIGFPGLNPVQDIENWDSGLDISEWETDFSSDSWDNVNKSFQLKTSGVLSISGSIIILIDGDTNRWIIDSECFNDEMVCEFRNINQKNIGMFNFSIHDTEPSKKTPVQLRFIIQSEGIYYDHFVSITYNDFTSPSPVWERENLSINDKICNTVEVKNNQTGNLSVTSNPFWSLESSGHLSEEGLHEICLISDRGGWESLAVQPPPLSNSENKSVIYGYKMAPNLEFRKDNGDIINWRLPINNSYISIFTDSEFGISLDNLSEGILYSDEGISPYCPFKGDFPTIDVDSVDNLSLIQGSPLIFIGGGGSQNLLLPSDGWLVNCVNSSSQVYMLNHGISVTLDDFPLTDSALPLTSFSLQSNEVENISLNVEISTNLLSDDSLILSVPNHIPSNGSVDIEISITDDDDDVWRVFWISQDSSGLVLNFVSKCPIGGCLN